VNSYAEFIRYAKANPGRLNYGSVGANSAPYLEMELLKKEVGIDVVHVPFNGSSTALVALLGNEIQLTFGSIQGSAEQVIAGKLKALAVTSAIRSVVYPDLPTIAEAAHLPDFDFGTWYGALAPAGTPTDIVSKLRNDMVAVMSSPDAQPALASFGGVIVGSSPEEFSNFIAKDVARWGAVMQTLGIKPQPQTAKAQ
jgi:tripartite-type tricarboxylate transporter receptor subunit TctC